MNFNIFKTSCQWIIGFSTLGRINSKSKLYESPSSFNLATVFKGTKEIVTEQGHGAFSGISPSDKGVDISGIEALASGKWKALMG